jgi:two-component system, cell cycle sensor histidine kinase and response regulator CckA
MTGSIEGANHPGCPNHDDIQDLLRYIIKHDSSAVALFDNDLHYLAVSDRFLEDYRVRDQDVIGTCFYDIFPDIPEAWKEAHRVCLAGQVVRNEDDWYEHADGSITHNRWECRPWFRSNETIGGMVLYSEVTTERIEAEEALIESEDRYRQLFDVVSDAIIVVDAETGQVLEVNRAACSVYGYTRDEWLSMKNTDVSDEPEDTRMTMRGAATWIPIRRQRGKDGRTILVEMTATHFDYRGRPAILGVMRDVTAREEAAQALRDSEEQLRQSQKMEAVGQLAGGIAHDFNNLLMTIMGYSELLLASDCSNPEQIKADICEIRIAADRAKKLTGQILAFSRRQIQAPEVVAVNSLVTDAEQLLRRTLPENIEIIVSTAPDAGTVNVDPGHFSQVLMNIALNSKDAMPNGGTLTIATGAVTLDADFTRYYPDCPPGGYVMIEVTDTGTGMDLETQSHAFEPFFTTKPEGTGTGLGLSTVHGIVKQSGGHIVVESVPGVGSTLRIFLPPAGEVSTVTDQTPTPTSVPAAAATILVVEDQDAVRTLVKRVLEREGYKVLAAPDGRQALQFLEEGTDVDLLLTDIVLPGEIQGDALAHQALQIRPNIPLLFMSGYLRNASIAADQFEAKVDFLQKPFPPDILCNKIRITLERARRSS